MTEKTTLTQKVVRIIMGTFMTVAGIAHLTFQREAFVAQVPKWFPSDPAFIDFVVVSSGVVEILLGLAMIFLTKYRIKVGIALAIFYVLIFPGNISQYTNEISQFGLDTDNRRLLRLFFQPVLIFFALWSTGSWSYLIDRYKKN